MQGIKKGNEKERKKASAKVRCEERTTGRGKEVGKGKEMENWLENAMDCFVEIE